jgi:hypothetical protein
MDQTSRICPWCSTPIPAEATACPKCGALVEGAPATDLPGLTTVDPEASLGPQPGALPNPLSWLQVGGDSPLTNEAAVQPPSDAVRLEMRKMELEAEIENAGTVLMNPTGDESLEADAPSDEAIAAHEAGELDPTGPAGETDLDVLAEPWEDPDLAKHAGAWRREDGEQR